ncbi:hypothetical protein V494_03383 [Pseudogymnoascus sp. VKM F-4513 (FW-928)]|nr:hypothetical protein V494_03383 [Pseudogymnoascus sp. VKM F-4513 (FW-928)]
MDDAVFEDSPLASYFEGDGDKSDTWSADEKRNDSSSANSSPSFAPRGRPTVPSRFRHKLNSPLRISVPKATAASAIRNTYSIKEALNSRLGKADNTKFQERFRYIIVASQLLNDRQYHGQPYGSKSPPRSSEDVPVASLKTFSPRGAVVTASVAFGVSWMIRWGSAGQNWISITLRCIIIAAMVVAAAIIGQAYLRRKWLQYLREQNIAEATRLVGQTQDLDSAVAAALSLIQEVELVSRGYRLSLPLPPITRLEDRSQARRCLQLRRALFDSAIDLMRRYYQGYLALQPLTEPLNLEKYYDIYDITTVDMQEALTEYTKDEFEDYESLRVLKILISRFVTLRKLVLCCLLALEADGGKEDFTRWRTAVEEIKGLSDAATAADSRVRAVFEQEESFPVPTTPKSPLTPGRERWRDQLRKLNTLSTGIRSLQAKMHVLREESDKTLDESEDISQLGPHLMIQYDAIGVDLRSLMKEWEAGKAALANTIDRNERRISSMSGLLSPTTSLGGLTSVEEGTPADALKALNGESRLSPELSSENEEVFEAIGLPRPGIGPRSTLTREERIVKMKEDRVKRETARETAEASTKMLRELESQTRYLNASLAPPHFSLHENHVNYNQRNFDSSTSTSPPYLTHNKPQNTAKMLEARLEQANLLKKVVDAIKDLVQDCNFDCNDSGIALQAMDNSHVALVSMMLKAEGFSPYRCDRNIALGVNLTSLTKVLRAAQNEDILTIKAEDAPDVLNLVFESSDSDRLSEYDLKLMDIDQEHLGIPETEYSATVSMPSAEFKRICMDLMALSESVSIEASKDGVKFSCAGDIGNGAVTLRSHTNVDKPENNVEIELSDSVALTFSLKYLVNFCKASGLSGTVKLCLSPEVPLLVEYALAGSSYLRFYLAPKIGDDE